MVFVNGEIPLSELAQIPGSDQYIARELLPSVVALQAAFLAHFGEELAITEGYRNRGTQDYLYAGWEARKPGFNLAAYPGTSPHGLAYAIDFGSHVNEYGSPQKEWMDANAPAYGWIPTGNSFIPKEAWHFQGGGPITADIINKLKGIDLSNLRIISGPSYEAAGQRILHNGSACQTYPAGWLDMLRQKGVETSIHDSDSDMLTEVNMVWELGGLSNAEAVEKIKEMIKDIPGISETDIPTK